MACTTDNTDTAKGDQHYDTVIVGGGTAEWVLANRLSEDPDISILVLEAGEDRNIDERIYTPGLGEKLLNNPDFDWQYASEPQPGMNDCSMKHPREKVLGGSSAINSFALIYPSAADLDAWADLGNEGWDWAVMKPYYQKFQTVCPPAPEVRKQLSIFHNDEAIQTTIGPLQASFPLTVLPLQKAWVERFRALGLENRSEALDGAALGGHISTSHIDGKRQGRSHAGIAYFESLRDLPNLHLTTGAVVHRIVFNKRGDDVVLADRVEYMKDGALHQVQV